MKCGKYCLKSRSEEKADGQIKEFLFYVVEAFEDGYWKFNVTLVQENLGEENLEAGRDLTPERISFPWRPC